MRLEQWLLLPDKAGAKRLRIELAARLGVSPSIITAWCRGHAWPSRPKAELIVQATRGAVSPLDFMSLDAQKLIRRHQLQSGRRRRRRQ